MTKQFEESRIPSVESSRTVGSSDSSNEVAAMDRLGDYDLRQLRNMAPGISCSHGTAKDAVDKLAGLVCTQMGEHHM